MRVGFGSEYWAREEGSGDLDLLDGISDNFGVEYVLERFVGAPLGLSGRSLEVRWNDGLGSVSSMEDMDTAAEIRLDSIRLSPSSPWLHVR
jgi:hypothetical protein